MMSDRLLRTTLARFVCSTAPALAQSPVPRTWRELTPAAGPAPEARRNGVAVHDPVGRRVVIFGGVGAAGYLNDVWAFDYPTLSWQRLETTGDPPGAGVGHEAG